MKNLNYTYDVVISFAGEDRKYARSIASCLEKKGVDVFFDENLKAQLWGKDLYQHLSTIYKSSARYCIIIISDSYARKLWTNHELRSAQERALQEITQEYILPVRLDDTILPGLASTIGYIDLRNQSIENVADLVCEKLGYVDDKIDYPVTYKLINMSVTTGTHEMPKTTVKIKVRDKLRTATSVGDGPIDATYKAIQKISKSNSKLLKYKVREMTIGDHELGQVFVTLMQGKKIAVGHGVGTDITISSAMALLNALNKLDSFILNE
ncbi:MAG: TIR domain-containing protein [Nitrospirae bacterium]|nr:TIR domain-containing protein [Nitrospirota bacterium]